MLLPKNSLYNRQLNLLDKPGTLLIQKNGIVYFYFEINPGERLYLKCDENLFNKQFEIESNETPSLNLSVEELEALMKLCKKYPY